MSLLKKKLRKIKRKYERLQSNTPITNKKSPIWTTREGDKIPINEMSDSHLANTIRYLQRRNQELGGGRTRDRFALYRDLRKEATERGLKI